MPRQLKECGTIGAARRHQRSGEQLCNKCRLVWAKHQNRMYEQRKATQK